MLEEDSKMSVTNTLVASTTSSCEPQSDIAPEGIEEYETVLLKNDHIDIVHATSHVTYEEPMGKLFNFFKYLIILYKIIVKIKTTTFSISRSYNSITGVFQFKIGRRSYTNTTGADPACRSIQIRLQYLLKSSETWARRNMGRFYS